MTRMKTKKGQGSSLYSTLGTIVIVVLLVLIGSYVFKGQVEAATKTISPYQVKASNEACKIRNQGVFGNQAIKEEIEGSNGDKYPDDCDMCLGGDNNKISNSMGIPDACYAESTLSQKIKTYKDMCKARAGCYISDTNQCCVGEAIAKCRPRCK